MRRIRRWGLALAPLTVAFLSFAALTRAAPFAQPGGSAPPEAPLCTAGAFKSADPTELILGQTTQVTLVFTQTCVAKRVPIDIMILADESHSMTRQRASIELPTTTPRVPPPTPDPSEPAPPAPTSGPGPGEPGEPGGGNNVGRDRGEPPGCITTPVGGGIEPGTPAPRVTPTPRGGPPDPVPPAPLVARLGALWAPDQAPPTKTPDTNPGPPSVPTDMSPGGPNRPAEPEPAGTEDLLREVSKFMQEFLRDPQIEADLDSGLLRVGFAAFGNRGRTLLSLNTGELGKRVGTSGNRLTGQGLSRVDLGLRQAETELLKPNKNKGADSERRKVILVLSDGAFCSRDLARARVGNDIDVVTVFVGRGSWRRRLDQLASEGRYAFSARELKQIFELYQQELSTAVPTRMDQLLVHDTVAPDMALDGAANPPASVVRGPRTEWWGVHPSLPVTTTNWHWAHSVITPGSGIRVTDLMTVTGRMTMSYRVRPLAAGSLPVSELAAAEWHESTGGDGLAVFPQVFIDVVAPTPTPTQTPTSTPTPTVTPTATPTDTPTPEARYFPIAIRSWPEPTPTATVDPCPPELQRVDLAIVVDNSTSMSGTTGGSQSKLQAAIVAGKTLVGLLKLNADGSGDQAAVIAFNLNATVMTTLTGDRTAVDAALDRVPSLQAQGTFIDRALQAAIDELDSPRRRPGSTRSIVLVTDGVNNGDDARVRQLADQLRAADVAVFTVGLGLESDIDADLLRAIATTPENYRHAPTTDDLELIYRDIARLIPCPRDRP